METYELNSIEMMYHDEALQLQFDDAVIVIVTEYGDKLWYININGVKNEGLLSRFGRSEDIRITVKAAAKSGIRYSGIGYFHPNEPHDAAAIRGDRELVME